MDDSFSPLGSISKDVVGLDGVANSAHTLTDDDPDGDQFIAQQLTVPDDTNPLVHSMYIGKDSDESRFPRLYMDLRGGTTTLFESLHINTKTGAFFELNKDGAFEVQDAGDFWRVVLTLTNNGSGNTKSNFRIYPAVNDSLDGSGSNTTGSIVYDFGQVELNASFATSPIETGSSAVTRNADDASMSLPSELASGFVWVVHARLLAITDRQYIGSIDDGSGDNRVLVWINVNGILQFFVESSTTVVVQKNFNSTPSAGIDFKIAIRAQKDDYAFSIDGGTVVTDSSGAFPSNLDTKNIGQRHTATAQLNGTIALDKMYANPGDWSDSDLQEASS